MSDLVGLFKVVKTRHRLDGNRYIATSADGLHVAYGRTVDEARKRLQKDLKDSGKL